MSQNERRLNLCTRPALFKATCLFCRPRQAASTTPEPELTRPGSYCILSSQTWQNKMKKWKKWKHCKHCKQYSYVIWSYHSHRYSFDCNCLNLPNFMQNMSELGCADSSVLLEAQITQPWKLFIYLMRDCMWLLPMWCKTVATITEPYSYWEILTLKRKHPRINTHLDLEKEKTKAICATYK